jgi:hypothetical protein
MALANFAICSRQFSPLSRVARVYQNWPTTRSFTDAANDKFRGSFA